MSAKRTKLVVMSLFLLCIFGCIGIAEIAKKNSEGQAPAKELQITLAVSQREELFAKLREFAEKHAFEFSLTFYDRDHKIFLVAMYQEDLKILVNDVPKAPTKIDLDFYERNPARPIPKETLDGLVNDLKGFISEIPNVTITEEK